jgi:hypothetical protein
VFFIRFLLRIIGFNPKPRTAAEIKEQQMIDFNRKRNIIMTAVGAAQQNQAQASQSQGQGQAQVVNGGEKGAPTPGSQTLGEALKKSAEDHDQKSVIGKSKGGRAGWQQRTGRSRTVRKRVRRRKERSLTLWR